ncbi:integumentary mucin C.1-like [Plectropomus leopardus]|uniref:integumentary mucin C.1-like n=1 Tax=Plectropomus leopardus TaxID=160734 RepID=UPI001C4AAA20|nr:integumentary mucin C.1-like [Plectropomus leopardus]
MLKELFVLGCLLSLTLAQPMERKRFARSISSSNSGSGSRETINTQRLPSTQQWLDFITNYMKFLQQQKTTTATTTPTTTTTTTKATTTAKPTTTKVTTTAAAGGGK